jgi:FMN phosphatase YigB (HAD superfamily)
MSTRLIIAVDYDGTIANTHAEAVKWIKTHVGRDVEPWQCNRTDCVRLIGKSPYEEMNDYVYERESTLAAAEVPGAANALRALTVIGDVFVVTNRRLHRIAYAREWLERMGLALSIREVITSHDSSKEQVCHQIGAHVLIDDDVRHLRDVRLEGLQRVWLQHGRTQIDDCPMGVAFCSHWDEVLGVLGVSG